MPTLWMLDLDEKTDIRHKSHYDSLHGIACRIFEQPESNHTANDKAFAVRLSPQAGEFGLSRLTFAWLDDATVPDPETPEKIQFGPHHIVVVSHQTRTVPYETLEALSPRTRIRFSMTSPTVFSHRETDLPLPDPYVTFASLTRRYAGLRQGPWSADVLRRLPSEVTVTEPEVRAQSFHWHGTRTGGFVGAATFQLRPRADKEVTAAFTTLSAFAAIAGLGRGTTHGLGSTAIEYC
jgi:hypothetical protein